MAEVRPRNKQHIIPRKLWEEIIAGTKLTGRNEQEAINGIILGIECRILQAKTGICFKAYPYKNTETYEYMVRIVVERKGEDIFEHSETLEEFPSDKLVTMLMMIGPDN